MAKVKLGEVAREYKSTSSIREPDTKIVGLEHLTPEEITLSNWDENVVNTFTKVFKKGHVLFGRRRAYLKKAAYAPFDGICSGDITVIEAIEGKIISELLPFIIQNDKLFDFAVGKSAGSLSPRVKWEHLKKYEFDLPSIEEQKKLAKILWAAEKVKQKCYSCFSTIEGYIKETYLNKFCISNNRMTVLDFCHVFIDDTKNGFKLKQEQYLKEGKYPIIDQSKDDIAGYKNEVEGIYNEVPTIIFGDHTRVFKYIEKPFFLGADGTKILKCKLKNINLLFMYYQLCINGVINTGYNRHYSILKEKLIIPNIDEQNSFICFVEKLNNIKSALENEILTIQEFTRNLIKGGQRNVQ